MRPYAVYRVRVYGQTGQETRFVQLARKREVIRTFQVVRKDFRERFGQSGLVPTIGLNETIPQSAVTNEETI